MKRLGVAVALALTLLAVLAAILVGPGVHATGALSETDVLELGDGATTPGVTKRGPVSENVDGYLVGGRGEGVVTVALRLPYPRTGRTLLRIWAYGPPGVRTTAVLRAADGSERTLGRATRWVGETFDVTEQARLGPSELRVRAENATRAPALFLDRLVAMAAPATLQLTASAWSVALLIGLVTAALLAIAGRLARHWPLALLLAAAAAGLWREIANASYVPLEASSQAIWAAATRATWLGLDDGLLWGSWTGLPSLAVSLGHALTPIVGTAPASARAAAGLTALLALAAIYAFGHRAAGRGGAAFAVVLALAAGPGVRDAVTAGAPLPALVLAGALFGYALHACLAEATRFAIAALGAAAALLAVADPAWLPGALAAVVVVALAYAVPGQRLRVAGVGLLAALVCLLPHLASTASQNDGRMLGDLDARAVAARNAEFPAGVHGVPAPQDLGRDPLGGRPVTLTDYLFAMHSSSQLAGGALAGGHDSLRAFGPDGRGSIASRLALLAIVAGALFVLCLARLRMLVLLTALVAAPALFIADRASLDPAAAGAVTWPALLVCAAILGYASMGVARPALDRQGSRLAGMRARVRNRGALGDAATPAERPDA